MASHFDQDAIQNELAELADSLQLKIRWEKYPSETKANHTIYHVYGRVLSTKTKEEDDSSIVPLHTRFKHFAKKAAVVVKRELDDYPNSMAKVMRSMLAFTPAETQEQIAEYIASNISKSMIADYMELGVSLQLPHEIIPSLDESQTISPFIRVQAACEAIKQEAQKAGIEFRFNVQVTDEPAERGNVILAAFFAVDEAKDSIAPPKVRAKVVARSIASNFKRFVKEGTWFSFASNDDYTGPKTLKTEDDIRVAMEYSLDRALVQQIFTPFFLKGDVHSEYV